jgi:DNA-binding NarL/FixJ family response regulator
MSNPHNMPKTCPSDVLRKQEKATNQKRQTKSDKPTVLALRNGWETNMQRQPSFATILIGKSVLIREGIAGILRASNFRTLASASCVEDLPAGKFQQTQILFLIVHTGDDFDAAIQQIELLQERHPKGRVAIVADHCQQDEMVSAYRAGAKGYFVNIMTCDVFIKSIELVMMGETIFPQAFLTFTLDPESDRGGKAVLRAGENSQGVLIRPEDASTPQLSPRERLILNYLIQGNSNKCIARQVDIAEATVKVHVKAILRKIRVQNRTQAAIWAMNNGSLAGLGNAGNVSSAVSDSPPVAIALHPVEVPAIESFIAGASVETAQLVK